MGTWEHGRAEAKVWLLGATAAQRGQTSVKPAAEGCGRKDMPQDMKCIFRRQMLLYWHKGLQKKSSVSFYITIYYLYYFKYNNTVYRLIF